MGLLIAVAVLNATSPWLCCRLCAATTELNPTPATPVPVACPHCPNCGPDREPVSAPHTPPATPAKSCPYKDRLLAADAVLPAPLAADASAVALDDFPPLLLADPASRLFAAAAEAVSDLPFLTTAVRLRAHHAMLC